ncbi:MAG: hypothetical protein KDA30_05400 [Phycisphaerales bacterium]|nr:hypothetical protein [Phycisphaerales bacterium]
MKPIIASTLALLFLVAPLIARQPADQPTLPNWVAARLAQLSPDRPMEYFELGEEVSYELPGPLGRSTAQSLFVLAYLLDDRLGPHACLALADVTTSAEERQWLLAMAQSMGSSQADSRTRLDRSIADDDLRNRLADAIRVLRAEDGRLLREVLSTEPAAQFITHLKQSDPVLSSALAQASAAAQSANGCPRCRNRRIVSGSGARAGRSICPRCIGNPGLALSERDMLDSLRVEAQLRDAEPATWSATLVLTKDRPLRDIRADDLARTYSVDQSRTIWSAELGWHAPKSD